MRLGVPFMNVFQEGATITARNKNLIILLPPGKQLGFKRIDTILVTIFGAANYPIYKFTKQVTVGKKISFLEMSSEIGSNLDSEINRLMDR